MAGAGLHELLSQVQEHGGSFNAEDTHSYHLNFNRVSQNIVFSEVGFFRLDFDATFDKNEFPKEEIEEDDAEKRNSKRLPVAFRNQVRRAFTKEPLIKLFLSGRDAFQKDLFLCSYEQATEMEPQEQVWCFLVRKNETVEKDSDQLEEFNLTERLTTSRLRCSVCFFLAPKSAPSVVELQIKSNRKGFVKIQVSMLQVQGKPKPTLSASQSLTNVPGLGTKGDSSSSFVTFVDGDGGNASRANVSTLISRCSSSANESEESDAAAPKAGPSDDPNISAFQEGQEKEGEEEEDGSSATKYLRQVSSHLTIMDEEEEEEEEIEIAQVDIDEIDSSDTVEDTTLEQAQNSEAENHGVWGSGHSLLPLVQKGRWFYEYHGPDKPLGRTVLLRGVNLGGNVKLPFTPDSRSHIQIDWGSLKDPNVAKALSFVGRPFPLSEADEHLSRLRRWGFNCFRFLVTWEAIEHAGPGIYDVEYLDYVKTVVELAGRYGFYVFIDPHQDVWSRMTGGSGAPAWTFAVAGLDLAKLERAEACFTHNSHGDPAKFPRMTWPQNYQRFAAMHMFTCFWGGNDYCPHLVVDDGIPIQEYLQSHFINAMMEVAKRVQDMPHVIGFDSFNEPSQGFIGHHLEKLPDPIIPPGPVFKPFDAMVTAAGYPRRVTKVNSITIPTRKGHYANPKGVSVWLDGMQDVWQDHGVWGVVQQQKDATIENVPVCLKPEYFLTFPQLPNVPISFFRDFLRPFMIRYISKIRSVLPRAILFAEGEAFGEHEFVWDSADPPGIVNATHWYDGYTLFTSNFNPRFSVDTDSKLPVFGNSRIRAMHTRNLKKIINLPEDLESEKVTMPTLIGEFGIPVNMNKKHAFLTGDFSRQIQAQSMYYDIFDSLQLHSTQWNYTSDCCNEWGDNWNLEDLSLFSRDQQVNKSDPFFNLDDGGRGVLGFCRPYAPFVCGDRIMSRFDSSSASKQFVHVYRPSPQNFETGEKSCATLIYVPDCQYVDPRGSIIRFGVEVVGGVYSRLRLPGRHIFFVWATSQSEVSKSNNVKITIITKSGQRKNSLSR